MSHPIPQPRPLPLLGNILSINPNNPWRSLQRLSEELPGDIFQVTVLGRTVVFIAGAALAEEVCDERRFRKYVGGPVVEIRYAVHDALFTAFEGEGSWGVAHRICAPVLLGEEGAGDGDGEGVDWVGEMVGCVGEMIGKWRRERIVGMSGGDGGDSQSHHIEDGSSVDDNNNNNEGSIHLIDELNRLNLEATTLTLFGQKLGCITAREPHPMLQAMEDATSEAMLRPTRPGLVNWLLYSHKLRRATRVMREGYAAGLLSHRRRDPAAGRRRDLLWALMEGKDPLTGMWLTESRVLDEIVSMPIGSSTAPCLVASAVYFLCRSPGCLVEARRELDEVLGPWMGEGSTAGGVGGDNVAGDGGGGGGGGGGGARQLTAKDLPRLKYMEGIIRESLRLSAAAPGFNVEPIPRQHQGDGEGGEGVVDKAPVLLAGGKYQIAHDQPMIIVLAGVNRDPSVFEDPLAFRPERMMGERFERLPAGVKWFGNGKRVCIGRNWAWQFSMVVMAMLVRKCEFEMVDPEWELDGRQDGWFNLRPVGFWVRVKPRVAS
ncbi:hypothetical protein VPNG_06412 [Cytospora leucostoma]|uniref:Cytochrome P450 n=1 Tax=Cytospora leucostoma TaxID=1230097 RepID=A0A423WYW6_9PEZI|nr:hypothetical protein VPNG_06412 [Cytospora leucostoma]